ncbi:hypothetical protein FQR65_LT02370 [Abscondita terminalis]|nr:hypothetical protein FQR65_LT02370 [Abscondita terminalis]
MAETELIAAASAVVGQIIKVKRSKRTKLKQLGEKMDPKKKCTSVAVLCSFKMPLRLQEAVDIIAIYFECLENATIAARLYALRYPQRRRYGSRMFSRLANRFRTTGTEENVFNVLAYVEFNPQLSVLLGPLV